MLDNLILDFPILRKDSSDFRPEIAYEVKAKQGDGKLYIRHSLKGRSFISNLLEQGKAKFSVRLLYQDSSERQHHLYDESIPPMQEETITIMQTIPMDFSYAPEVMPSIIVLEDVKITVNASSGLTDFWTPGESLFIPRHARIAIGSKLTFSKGDLFYLMEFEHIKEFGDGEMEVKVREHAGEGEPPVRLRCGKHVYDQLRKVRQEKPCGIDETIGSAIATQALCATYAYMQNLAQKENQIGGVLLNHLQMLEHKTGKSWEDEDFEPSLAATKMNPYTLIETETDDE